MTPVLVLTRTWALGAGSMENPGRAHTSLFLALLWMFWAGPCHHPASSASSWTSMMLAFWLQYPFSFPEPGGYWLVGNVEVWFPSEMTQGIYSAWLSQEHRC